MPQHVSVLLTSGNLRRDPQAFPRVMSMDSRDDPLWIGPYEVVAALGQGGMGIVHLARHPSGRLVVVKRALREEPDADDRLRDEGRLGLLVSHPHIVQTLDVFEDDGHPVVVTAYVPGASFLDLRENHGPLHPAVVCQVGHALGLALHALHSAVNPDGRLLQLLHRDVTASNVLMGFDGRVRLIDLGIARANDTRTVRTKTGFLRGTFRYLAPELFDGGDYSPLTDLWSLGVVLFEALIGRAIVRGTEAEAIGRICSGTIARLEPGEMPDPVMLRAIERLLQKDVRTRPQSAMEAAAMFAMLQKGFEGSDPANLAATAVATCISGQAGVEPKLTETEGFDIPSTMPASLVGAPGGDGSLLLSDAILDTAPQTPADAFANERSDPSVQLLDYAARLKRLERAG
jgi:eukaryotic-like serine/threonine-protein kinase